MLAYYHLLLEAAASFRLEALLYRVFRGAASSNSCKTVAASLPTPCP